MRGGVLQVITDTDRRGAQVFACDLADALAARGRDVRTVALVAGRDEAGLPVPTLGRRSFEARTLLALRREARRARVVVGHGSKTLAACAVATLGTGVPFVYRNIGDPRYWNDTPARRLRTRAALRRARAVVALWPRAADDIAGLLGVRRDRIRVIPNGVPGARFAPPDHAAREDARRSLGIANGMPAAVCMGSLSPEKNVEGAVLAVGAVPDLLLLVVGDGPARERLAALADRVAPGRVRFTGATERPEQALAAADVLVLPSLTEGIPAVVIEAGLSGLPVVATDVGGVGQVVADRETGRLVAPGDAEALADALREAVAQAGSLGPAARARCLERFEISPIATAWDEVLGELGAWT